MLNSRLLGAGVIVALVLSTTAIASDWTPMANRTPAPPTLEGKLRLMEQRLNDRIDRISGFDSVQLNTAPQFVAGQSRQANITLPGSGLADFPSLTFEVPPTFTKALVTATAQATGYKTTTGTGSVYVGARVNGDLGSTLGLSNPVAQTESASAIGINYVELDGLTPGDIITIEGTARVAPGGDWTSTSGNSVTITAQILWSK
jgi:hypothetical protein